MLKAHWEVFGGFAALRLIPVFSSRAEAGIEDPTSRSTPAQVNNWMVGPSLMVAIARSARLMDAIPTFPTPDCGVWPFLIR